MEELDTEPTLEELSKAIDSLASGKAPGSNGIPPHLLKHCKTTLLHSLHVLLCQCWQERTVSQDMRDPKIICLFKNKGEKSDCNNYRGFSLLNVVGKVLAKVIFVRLQKLAERVYPESQCGFRAGRSTIDMVSLRQLQEKCKEQQMPLYIAFIDLTKAFDLVSRDGLFQSLPKIGCSPKLQSMIESFHTNMKGTVQFNGSSSRPFDIHSGVKQGCVLAPTLSGIFFALHLRHAFGTVSEGICLRTRSGSSDDPHPAGAACTDGPFLTDLQGFRTNHQSEEDKRPGGRIQWNCPPSPSMTMSSMSLNSSRISAPPSLTTSPWTLRLIRGLGRQPQHLLASLHECGPTPN